MKSARESLIFVAQLCLAGACPLLAQTSPLLPSQKAPLSDRVVAYQMKPNTIPKTIVSLRKKHSLG